MPQQVAPKVLSWASEIEPDTIQQAATTARLPIVHGHVALMPDAHLGLGATVGSVIPTEGAIIPAAVGVDIGCGMVASETTLTAADLPDDLTPLMSLTEQRIPAGVGKGHEARVTGDAINELLATGNLWDKQQNKARRQFGSLGSGNHFVEVCIADDDTVWTVLHSGSRGVGNELARQHIESAKGIMRQYQVALEDPDLAYFAEGTPEFAAYIADMLWAQRYAMESRAQMDREITRSLFEIVGRGSVRRTINCHHNYSERETHNGVKLWVTRKGAIRADTGDHGVIPGSMGTSSYIVRGLGNRASWNSCAHGAGRRMSRSRARRELTADSLAFAMHGRTWNADRAEHLVDEHPDAYKDVEQVMADQRDLVEVEHVLHQIFNYKG